MKSPLSRICCAKCRNSIRIVDNRGKPIYTVPIIHQSAAQLLFYTESHRMIDIRGRYTAINTVRVIPKLIPRMVQRILCAAFLEAALRFYKDPKTKRHSKSGVWGKEEMPTDRKTAMKLRKEYPIYTEPLIVLLSEQGGG